MSVADLIVSRRRYLRFLRPSIINLYVRSGQTGIQTDGQISFIQHTGQLAIWYIWCTDVPLRGSAKCEFLKHACVFYMFIIVACFSINTAELSIAVVDVWINSWSQLAPSAERRRATVIWRSIVTELILSVLQTYIYETPTVVLSTEYVNRLSRFHVYNIVCYNARLLQRFHMSFMQWLQQRRDCDCHSKHVSRTVLVASQLQPLDIHNSGTSLIVLSKTWEKFRPDYPQQWC